MLEKKKEKYFYTSSDLAKLLTVKLKRRVRASHVDEVAVKLGRFKNIPARQANLRGLLLD